MQAPRLAERPDKAVHALLHAGDHHGPLPEIDLKQLARARFKAHRGARGGTRRLSQRRYRPLDRPQRYGELMLAEQRLAHDIGIA